MPDATATEAIVSPSQGGGAMRYHELALQRWCYNNFLLAAGYPVPVIFSAPMDAFGHFKTLWKADRNPFKYLLDLKDERGVPVYEAYPATPKYPLISIHRKGWSYRSSQNFSTKRWRRINWPTVSLDPAKEDLGSVTTSKMPAAWNFRFQIDHFCLRPETQSSFITQLMNTFWRAGGEPQTWLVVEYPGHFYRKYVRMALAGDVESITPPEPEEGRPVEYRTSFAITVEGYIPDIDYQIFPALWTLVLQNDIPGSPGQLDAIFSENVDLRLGGNNPVMETRGNVPDSGPDYD